MMLVALQGSAGLEATALLSNALFDTKSEVMLLGLHVQLLGWHFHHD